jgi:hypothetical protein
VDHIDACLALEQLDREMSRSPGACRSDRQRSGSRLGGLDELAKRPYAEPAARRQHVVRAPDGADRNEVAHRIIRDVLCGGRNREQAHGRNQDRVAVGLAGQKALDRAQAVAPVFDEQRRAERSPERLGGEARRNIGRPACRIRDDHADRTRRVVVGAGDDRRATDQQRQNKKRDTPPKASPARPNRVRNEILRVLHAVPAKS